MNATGGRGLSLSSSAPAGSVSWADENLAPPQLEGHTGTGTGLVGTMITTANPLLVGGAAAAASANAGSASSSTSVGVSAPPPPPPQSQALVRQDDAMSFLRMLAREEIIGPRPDGGDADAAARFDLSMSVLTTPPGGNGGEFERVDKNGLVILPPICPPGEGMLQHYPLGPVPGVTPGEYRYSCCLPFSAGDVVCGEMLVSTEHPTCLGSTRFAHCVCCVCPVLLLCNIDERKGGQYKEALCWQCTGILCARRSARLPRFSVRSRPSGGDPALIECAARFIVYAFAAGLVCLILASLTRDEPLAPPPLVGVNSTLLGFSPPPPGALNVQAVTNTLLQSPADPRCTSAVASAGCWPFNDTVLAALLNLTRPDVFFEVARYAEATFPAPVRFKVAYPTLLGVCALAVLIWLIPIVWALIVMSSARARRLAAVSPPVFVARDAINGATFSALNYLSAPTLAPLTMLSAVPGGGGEDRRNLAQVLTRIFPFAFLQQPSGSGAILDSQNLSAAAHSKLFVALLSPDYLRNRQCCLALRASVLASGASRFGRDFAFLLPPALPGQQYWTASQRAALAAACASMSVALCENARELVSFCANAIFCDRDADSVSLRRLPSPPPKGAERLLSWWKMYGEPRRPLSFGMHTSGPRLSMTAEMRTHEQRDRTASTCQLRHCPMKTEQRIESVRVGSAWLADDGLAVQQSDIPTNEIAAKRWLSTWGLAGCALIILLSIPILIPNSSLGAASQLSFGMIYLLLELVVVVPAIFLRMLPLGDKNGNDGVEIAGSCGPLLAAVQLNLIAARGSAGARFRVIFVREASAAAPAPVNPSLFEAAALDSLVQNLSSFLQSNIGIPADQIGSETLLQPCGQDIPFPLAPGIIYVIFAALPDTVQRIAAASRHWSPSQVVLVLPPFPAAKGILGADASMTFERLSPIFSGANNYVEDDSPYPGILPAIFFAIACRVGPALLKRPHDADSSVAFSAESLRAEMATAGARSRVVFVVDHANAEAPAPQQLQSALFEAGGLEQTVGTLSSLLRRNDGVHTDLIGCETLLPARGQNTTPPPLTTGTIYVIFAALPDTVWRIAAASRHWSPAQIVLVLPPLPVAKEILGSNAPAVFERLSPIFSGAKNHVEDDSPFSGIVPAILSALARRGRPSAPHDANASVPRM